MKINFYLKRNKNKYALIYLKSWYLPGSTKAFVYSTKENVHEDFWDKSKQRAKKSRNYQHATEINVLLNRIEDACISAYYALKVKNNEAPSHELLRKELNKRLNRIEVGSFIDYARDLIDKRALQPEKYGAHTISSYKTAINKVEKYCKKERKGTSFRDITTSWLEGFQRYMYDQGSAKNTASTNWNKLKVFLNQASKDGLYTLNAHHDTDLAISYEPADKPFLTTDELMSIYALKLDKEIDIIVRDVFLLDAFSGGFRFRDLKNISDHNTIMLGDVEVIKIYTRKTQEMVYIPVEWYFKEFMEKYQGELPAMPAEPTFNRKIKDICRRAGITQDIEIRKSEAGQAKYVTVEKYTQITQYTARYSFATNLYLKNVKIRTIGIFLGHRKEETTRNYIKVKNIDAAQQLSKNTLFTEKPTVKLRSA